jgi:hypothetical protein
MLMDGLRKIKNSIESIINTVCSILPYQGIRHPVFVIGCGRSGTTILGTALSKHKHITYLNEPRHLWFTAFPETDIWTSKAASRNGKLVLTGADADSAKSEKLRRLFRFETIKSWKPVLVEKLPINNFRLQFIHKIFPAARYIHIYRNGLEVARSIEKKNEDSEWFGENSYKWAELVKHALSKHDTENLPAICSSVFDKGLLEWRLSTEAAVDFLGNLPSGSSFEIHYDAFMENPVGTISQVFDFLGLEQGLEVEEFVSETIVRRTSKLGLNNISEKEQLLGGKLLPLSMNAEQTLTNRRRGTLDDNTSGIENQ